MNEIAVRDAKIAKLAELDSGSIRELAELVEQDHATVTECAKMMRIIAERMEAMEREFRYLKPVSTMQARELNRRIRERAHELLEKKNVCDRASVNSVCRIIRKAIQLRWGVKSIQDVPRFDYETAESMILMWDDTPAVRKIIKKARENDGSAQNDHASAADAREIYQ